MKTLLRPVLLVDEAQETSPAVLNELRLLASARFDSRQMLSVVLAGDLRMQEKFRHQDLVALGSRIRLRLTLQPVGPEELRAVLTQLLSVAGIPALITSGIIATLCEHALGNYRVLMTLCGELLSAAAQRDLAQIDEKLFFEYYAVQKPAKPLGAMRPRR